jgi:shikimate 5-dehydrogenase
MILINKDTKIYGSFSTNPGNNGCVFFNNKFKENNVNAIYKSFYSNNIEDSVLAAKSLQFSGFAISMPFKTEVLKYIDSVDYAVKQIGAANTIVNKDGKLKAYNTDCTALYNYLKSSKIDSLTILGNGGFSKALQYTCELLNIKYSVVLRHDFENVPNLKGYVFNATPIDVEVEGTLIDGRPFTDEGKKIARLQAEEQYKIYMNE